MKVNNCKRIVVKLGTSVLTGGTKQLDRARMVDLVRQCAELFKTGHDVIVVTSAAVAAGRARLDFPNLPAGIVSKQLLAAVGQPQVMRAWEQLFDIYGVHTGQILLTRADVEHRRRFLNARNTFQALLEQRIVPVVNENDAVATEEIRVGDNDNLSALVATLVNADILLLLTDQAGLYTADPRKDPNAQLIRQVHKIDDDLRSLAGGTETGLGTGGMATKLQAATIARHAGAEVVIAAGREPNVVIRVVAGEAIGTHFVALDPLQSRKQWILAGPKPAGRLFVDAGAAKALIQQGRSLLPAGIKAVEGIFDRGDTVSIVDKEHHELARGLVAYSSEDTHKIIGHKTDQIAEILGYSYSDEVVHRNNLIVLTE
ncbi:MAG: glutamate 5-kinase [Caldilineaceae bacterium]